MKTKTAIISIALFFALFLEGTGHTVQAKGGYDFTTVTGTVKDKQTKKALEYVNVAIPGTSIGTVTNADGYFSIKVTDSIQADRIELSYLGYLNRIIPLKGEDIEEITIYLTPNVNTLPEVLIRGMNATELVKRAVSKIETNYSATPNLLTGFYRETVRKRRSYINVTEAVVNVYKTDYSQDLLRDRVEVFKGRQLVSPKRGDTLVVKLQGGPNMSLFLDVAKNRELIFDEQAFRDYSFHVEGSTMLDNRPHYVVGFEPQATQPYPLFHGKLYIDEQTLSFTQAEYSYNMKDRNKITHAILRKKPLNLRFKPEGITYLVTYRQEGGRSYLNYMRNEIKFKCDWKRKLFSTSYTVMSEMVITDKQLQNAVPIPGRQAFSSKNILSDEVASFYDENFWEGYNIIEPTESLESAVNKLKKKYD